MTIQNLRVVSGDVELAVTVHGDAERPVVVLVHGYPDSSHVWHKVVEPLSERYCVVVYDVRGAGDSTAPQATEAYELAHLVSDLAAVIDTVSPQRSVHLVAHDWGSIQSWEAVTTERLQGRIASYTTISGPSLDHAGYWILRRLRSGSPAQLAQVANQALHSWYIGAFHLPLVPSAWRLGLDQLWPKLLKKAEGISAPASSTQGADGERGIRLYRANVVRRLLAPRERHTQVPVQLVVPTRDRFVSKELLEDLPLWVDRLWRRDIAAGHWLQLSHPLQVVQYISEFVEFIESGVESIALQRSRVRAVPGDRAQPYAGKLALVTGAGGGIGRETLLMLAERGAEVIAVDIDRDAAERSAELARLLGATAHAQVVDVGNTAAMEVLAGWVESELGAPDIVINNAGIGLAGSFMETDAADWERLLRINLFGVIHGSRLFARQMIAAGKSGHIVNLASAAAYTPSRTLPAYSTSKAAVLMLSDCLRAELSDAGIHVLSVCPGIVDTGITQRTRFVGVGDDEQQRRRERASDLYRRRNLTPQAVAAAILDGIEQRKAEVLVGAEAVGMRLLNRYLPNVARSLARLDLAS